MSFPEAQLDQRPKLSNAARLRYDAPTRSYVLLSPERGLRLNETASEVVLRCTGELTVREIATELRCACTVEPRKRAPAGAVHHEPSGEEIARDILDLLVELRQRQLLFFDAVL
jgi:hypothetical protein